MELQYDKDSKERIPYEHYMELLQKADPEEISARTGIPYDQQSQTFTLHLLGVAYQVHFPDYVVRHDPESTVGYYPLDASCLWVWQQTGSVPVCNGKDRRNTSGTRRYRL